MQSRIEQNLVESMVSVDFNQDKSLHKSMNYFHSSVMRCSFVLSKGSSSFDRKGKCKERKK